MQKLSHILWPIYQYHSGHIINKISFWPQKHPFYHFPLLTFYDSGQYKQNKNNSIMLWLMYGFTNENWFNIYWIIFKLSVTRKRDGNQSPLQPLILRGFQIMRWGQKISFGILISDYKVRFKNNLLLEVVFIRVSIFWIVCPILISMKGPGNFW